MHFLGCKLANPLRNRILDLGQWDVASFGALWLRAAMTDPRPNPKTTNLQCLPSFSRRCCKLEVQPPPQAPMLALLHSAKMLVTEKRDALNEGQAASRHRQGLAIGRLIRAARFDDFDRRPAKKRKNLARWITALPRTSSGLDPKKGPESFISNDAKAHKQFLDVSGMTSLNSVVRTLAKALQLMRTEVWQKWLHHSVSVRNQSEPQQRCKRSRLAWLSTTGACHSYDLGSRILFAPGPHPAAAGPATEKTQTPANHRNGPSHVKALVLSKARFFVLLPLDQRASTFITSEDESCTQNAEHEGSSLKTSPTSDSPVSATTAPFTCACVNAPRIRL